MIPARSMNRGIALLFPLGILSPPAISAPDMESSLTVTGQWGYSTLNGTTQMLNGALLPEADLSFANGWRFTSSLRLRTEAREGMRPVDIERGAYSDYNQPTLLGDSSELELRELTLEGRIGDTFFSLGKQQVVWGKADGLKVLDIVDPQSFREFILEDFDDSRIPLWTLNVEQRIGGWEFQLLWIPDPTFHALPKPGATYAFTSPELVPTPPPGIEVRLEAPRRPIHPLRDSDVGLRIATFWRGWDITLNYLYQYDNQPVLRQNLTLKNGPPQVTVTPEYERTHVLGGTFGTAFGDWVVRGEMGYFSRKFFIGKNPARRKGVVQSPLLHYVLGLDWAAPGDILLSGQLIQSWLLQHAGRSTRDRLDTTFTLLVRRLFLYDNLTTEILLITNLNHTDGILRPRISYRWLEHLETWIGADLFYGDREGVFGQFGANNRLVVGIEAAF